MTAKSGNYIIVYDSVQKTLEEWAKDTGIPKAMILARLNAGWSVKDALGKGDK